jgi:hypothetical protein
MTTHDDDDQVFVLPAGHSPRGHIAAALHYRFPANQVTVGQMRAATDAAIESQLNFFQVPESLGSLDERFAELLRPSIIDPMASTVRSAIWYLDGELERTGQKGISYGKDWEA